MNKSQFVQNIKIFCERRNVKPTVACREAGVGTSFINNIEARGQTPSVEKVQLLAQYLGVTVSELLGEVSNPNALSDLPPTSLEWLIAQLNEEGQAKLLDLADDMVASGKYKKKNTASVG